MNWRAGLADAAFYGAAALILGGLSHFAIVLAIPLVAAHGAYERLTQLGPLDATLAAPQAGPRQRLLPYADPAVASAVCAFDLTNGPVRVRAPLGRAGFVIAVVSQSARVCVLRFDRHGADARRHGSPDRDAGAISGRRRPRRRG